MKTNLKIRRAKKEDIPEILSLGTKIKEFVVSNETKFYHKDELEEWVKKPKDNILITATKDDMLIGFLYAKLISNNWCMLDSIGINKNYRINGIGTSLLNYLYKLIKKREVNYIQTLTDVKHRKTREF